MTDLKSSMIDFLNEYDLNDKTIIVGFSGGFDSMCLLNILSEIKNLEGYDDLNIIAAHFNHNWRGEESRKEQEICRLFASSRGFEFVTKTAPNDLKKTENDARLARYEFFEDVLDDYDADAVFTAHNKDDNAETVLYRVVKGTGLYGLKGISVKRDVFYRPLLKISRAEILRYCDEHNLTPNNDSSNSNTEYNRNYLRITILPLLERINPLVKEALNTLSEVARSEDAIIDEYLSGIRSKVFKEKTIVSEEYTKLSEAVKMRLLHEYMREYNFDYDFKKIRDLYDFISQNISKRNGSTMSLTSSKWLYVDDKLIEVIPQQQTEEDPERNLEISISDLGEYNFGDKVLSLKKYLEKDVFIFPEATANFVYVDLLNKNLDLTLRHRRDGDVITPFGMNGSMKLKKYLNAKAVPRYKRDKLLVLADKNEILWVVGVGLSNKIGVTDVPTHVIEVR